MNSLVCNKVSGVLRLKVRDTYGTWFLGSLPQSRWLRSSPPESQLKLSYCCMCFFYLLLEVFANNAAASRDGKLTCIIN